MISFITPIKNRLDDLRLTFPHNYKQAFATGLAFEWVFVDWASNDLLLGYLTDQRDKLPCGGQNIKIISTRNRELEWSFARAKNSGLRVANGNLMANVDADNFITAKWVNALSKATSNRGLNIPICIIPPGRQRSDAHFGGAGGRIVLHRTVVELLRGYDESFVGYGYEDLDVIVRADNAGYEIVEVGEESDFQFLASPGALIPSEVKERKTLELEANAKRCMLAMKDGKSRVNDESWGQEPFKWITT